MRILDVDGNELQEEDIDLEIGYLEPDRILIEHHEAIPAQERIWHYAVKTVYFEDGTKVEIESEDDPRIEIIDAKQGHFAYKTPAGEEPRKLRNMQLKEVEDQPAVEGKEAWDEYEDIQRYKLYTEEEIAERERQRQEEEEAARKAQEREEFLESAPERLDTAEVDIEDLVLLMADIVGGDTEEEEEPEV